VPVNSDDVRKPPALKVVPFTYGGVLRCVFARGLAATSHRPNPLCHCHDAQIDSYNTIDVRTFESFNLKWKISSNYQAQPGAAYPIGVQTMDYPQGCFCNKTLTYCGNTVRSTLQPPGLKQDSPMALQVKPHPYTEVIGDGEFWPIVTHADAATKRDDLYSEIDVDRGYFTSGTQTTRQVLQCLH
jgi:hypothetical protein